MRGLRLLLCVVGLSGFVPALRAQYPVGSTFVVLYNYDELAYRVSWHLAPYLNAELAKLDTLNTTMSGAANAINSIPGALATGVAPLTTAANGMTAAAQQMTAAAQGVNTAVSGMAAQLAGIQAATLAVNTSAQGIQGEVFTLRQHVQQLGNAMAGYTTAMNANTAASQQLQNQVGIMSGSINNAIMSAGLSSSAAVNNLAPKLDAIKDILQTNDFANITNSISITATNGDFNFTNVVNVNLPDLSEVTATAYRTRTNAEALPPADHAGEVSAATASANDSTPDFGISASGMVAVNAGGFTADFLQVKLPNFFGNETTINLNPYTMHNGAFQSVFDWFRIALAWAATVLFLRKCAELAEKYLLAMTHATQFRTPALQILGTNLGKLAWPIYKATFIALALAFQSALTLMLTGASGLGLEAISGPTGGLSGLVPALVRNPFVGLMPDVITLIDKVFPLATLVSQFLFLLTARFQLWVAWWVYSVAIRLLPA